MYRGNLARRGAGVNQAHATPNYKPTNPQTPHGVALTLPITVHAHDARSAVHAPSHPVPEPFETVLG